MLRKAGDKCTSDGGWGKQDWVMDEMMDGGWYELMDAKMGECVDGVDVGWWMDGWWMSE